MATEPIEQAHMDIEAISADIAELNALLQRMLVRYPSNSLPVLNERTFHLFGDVQMAHRSAILQIKAARDALIRIAKSIAD